MIKYIHLENIKSLRKLSLSLGNMNLFYGMNGTGKSSVIQSILMLRQSYFREGNLDSLLINDGLVNLGTSDDILPSGAEKDEVVIRFIDDSSVFDLSYDCSSSCIKLPLLEDRSENPDYSSSLFNEGFAYISPGRQSSYGNPTPRSLNRIGNNGEYTSSILKEDGDRTLTNTVLIKKEAKNSSLIEQVIYWMGRITPGVRVLGEMERESLSFNYEYRPITVSSGTSYSLPVVVALLTATPGSIVILENPESHLHPRGQAELAFLMAEVAQSGVQVICESHSDHIINKVRVAIREDKLDADKTAVVYFSKNDKQETEVDEIALAKNGSLEFFPEGLLDEWGLLMERLI